MKKKNHNLGFCLRKIPMIPFLKNKKPYSFDLNLIELALSDIEIYCLKNAHTIIHRSNCPLG